MTEQKVLPETTPEPMEIESTQQQSVVSISGGDPDATLALLEKKADLAMRFKRAQETILATQTYPEDWHTFGQAGDARVCLSSAGAERVARLFDIRYSDVEHTKEEFVDGVGKGYRYIYEGDVEMGDRKLHVVGMFSTRDKFLGYANKEWKPIEAINESHIRSAAYHVFMGNGVKALLGLRGLPLREYQRIMSGTGQDAKKTSGHKYAGGSKGGTTKDDAEKQAELKELCLAVVNAGKYVERHGKEIKVIDQIEIQQELDPVMLAEGVCITISGFDGKDGEVAGKKADDLKGKWLNSTIGRAKDAVKEATK